MDSAPPPPTDPTGGSSSSGQAFLADYSSAVIWAYDGTDNSIAKSTAQMNYFGNYASQTLTLNLTQAGKAIPVQPVTDVDNVTVPHNGTLQSKLDVLVRSRCGYSASASAVHYVAVSVDGDTLSSQRRNSSALDTSLPNCTTPIDPIPTSDTGTGSCLYKVTIDLNTGTIVDSTLISGPAACTPTY